MIFTRAILKNDSTWSKGIDQAVSVLTQFARLLQYPLPTYDSKNLAVGSSFTVEELARSKEKRSVKLKKPPPLFRCQAQVKIPSQIYNVEKLLPYVPPTDELLEPVVVKKQNPAPVELLDFTPATCHDNGEVFLNGLGENAAQSVAQSLAAQEIVHQVERLLNVPRGELRDYMVQHEKRIKSLSLEVHLLKHNEPIPGVRWSNIPIDTSFASDPYSSATRKGNLQFFPELRSNEHALCAAKAITLAAPSAAPTVQVYTQPLKTDELVKRFANIKAVGGPIEGVAGTVPGTEINLGLNPLQAQVVALSHLYNTLTHETVHKKWKKEIRIQNEKMMAAVSSELHSSYGMAKLYVAWPKHQLAGLESTLMTIPEYQLPPSRSDVSERTPRPSSRRPRAAGAFFQKNGGAAARLLRARIESFRDHQKLYPLPVDSIESQIPFDASITIVRGGTGSGKTTRYPLMLNLFSPEPSRIIVAQPRRLACQTAARRVAQEQGYFLGKPNCPIGYSIRFETIAPSPHSNRTIEFQTPGVLLRYAAKDPLLSEVTHLCIDEIHERNADIDLILALAKQAVRRRVQHSELPPLRLILMSATLDSSHWESYFRGDNNGAPELSLKVVNVPEIRRFPIQTIHLCSDSFPLQRQELDTLIQDRGQNNDDFDEEICKVTAKLALTLYNQKLDGSILCFLPGMEEIRQVHRFIDHRSPQRLPPKVVYLHSSVSSAEQALAFEPGSKIILSTNIAETSVTIPDCKYVIDSGRERQYSLMSKSKPSPGYFGDNEAESSDSVTVVGSQLRTVDISQASAKQRAGRSGRVSAGTCYRLYTKKMYEYELPEFTEPEMLRMDLSQLVLHAISLYHPSTGGHPLSLLSGAPDPPSEANLRRTLRHLVSQGLVDVGDDDFSWSDISSSGSNGLNNAAADETKEHRIRLTPLGRAVNEFPVEPVVGRMLFMGLVLRAIDPALTIAALLSVPKVFSPSPNGKEKNATKCCSDIIMQMESYNQYIEAQGVHPNAIVFDQVRRIRNQLEKSMLKYLHRHSHRPRDKGEVPEVNWNANSARVVAQAALICCATPHIAHLVNGKEDFATRDVAGTARMNHSSVNVGGSRRAFWYVYHELRVVKAPNLYTTTAVSPLELALFTDSDFLLQNLKSSKDGESGLFEMMKDAFGDENWLFHADHWVPVVAKNPSHRDALLRLRRLLMFEMLQQVAQNPISFAKNTSYQQVILYVLSALEQQRLPPEPEKVIKDASS